MRKIRYSMILVFICFMILSSCSFSPNVQSMAAIGKAKFEAEALPKLVEALREETGLSDLAAESIFAYEVDESNYDEETKTLSVIYDICDFTIDEIDQYYTEDYNDLNGRLLYRMFNVIQSSRTSTAAAAWNPYTCEDQQGHKIVFTLASSPYMELDITTSAGRVYSYYDTSFSRSIGIDEHEVYWEIKSSPDTNSHTDNNGSYTPPQGSSKPSGGTAKSSKPSASSKSQAADYDDYYDVEDYDDPDDFADEYEEEFDDYDDAYDYWEDNHE